MKKNIFYLNETDKEKQLNPNNLERFDSKEIGLVLSSNPYLLMKHWISFQQEWVNNIYKEFKDYDKYIILMHLMSKSWQDSSSLFKYYSLDGYYSQNEIILPDLSLSDISRDLKIPKETIRRKLNELEKQNIIERKGQKIILSQLALSLQKPKNSIKKLSIFFEKLSILLSVQDWFGASVSREEIEIYFNKYYSVFWNRYYKMQIPFLIRWKTVFGDFDSWIIWANISINQSINLEKISKELKEEINLLGSNEKSLYLSNIQVNEPKQGINASSIAEISGIPRATVMRKLKKLTSVKILKRNKKLEYVLSSNGTNGKIKANYFINQKYIALFVTNIFNLIKNLPLKT